MKIQIEVICYGFAHQRRLEYSDIGNKVVVVEVKDSIRVGLMTIVAVFNRITYYGLSGFEINGDK